MEAVHIVAPKKNKVVLRQGLKRQIREMLWRVGGFDVPRLIRTRIGSLTDPRLKPGYWRPLDREEVAALRKSSAPLQPKAPNRQNRPGPKSPGPAGARAETRRLSSFLSLPLSSGFLRFRDVAMGRLHDWTIFCFLPPIGQIRKSGAVGLRQSENLPSVDMPET